MGRHFEVRAAAMAGTAAKKSALYMRASKEIYLAAKQGELNPDSNLTLRAALDKYRALGVTKDVIERALKKASGSELVAYIPGRYELMMPGGAFIIADTLTDNVNRAISDIKAAVKKIEPIFTNVAYNFTETGLFVFTGPALKEVIETLVLNDIDVWEADKEDNQIQVLVNPIEFGKTRDEIYALGVTEFMISEIRMIPNEEITLTGEPLEAFKRLIDALEDVQDIQEIYHNVIL